MKYIKWKCSKCEEEFITSSNRFGLAGCSNGCTMIEHGPDYTYHVGVEPIKLKESDNYI